MATCLAVNFGKIIPNSDTWNTDQCIYYFSNQATTKIYVYLPNLMDYNSI